MKVTATIDVSFKRALQPISYRKIPVTHTLVIRTSLIRFEDVS